MQGRTYAHSYHVCKFQGSSANSVGGDIGQDGRTDRQTDGGDHHNIPTFFSKSVGIIRFVLNLDHMSHIGNEQFKVLNWLPVQKRVEQTTLCHVFKIKNGLAPEYMSENFVPFDTLHSYKTRSSESGCYILPKVKGFGAKYFAFNACVL